MPAKDDPQTDDDDSVDCVEDRSDARDVVDTVIDSNIPVMETEPGAVTDSHTGLPDNAGGYVWEVSDVCRLRRFLCMSNETGTYHATEEEVTREHAKAVLAMMAAGNGEQAVREIVDFSVKGRTARQMPVIFSLALCARESDVATKRAAYAAVSRVCRVPTHLFLFVELCEKLSGASSGWGRAMRRCVSDWYNGREAGRLAVAVTKYRHREGWSHGDLLRLAHVKAATPAVGGVLKYIVKGIKAVRADFESNHKEDEKYRELVEYLEAVEAVKVSKDEEFVCRNIGKFLLTREHVPTAMLRSREVWRALLVDMPLTALLRNLGRLTAVGALGAGGMLASVEARLTDAHRLRAARIHPFNMLHAAQQYGLGKGDKGRLRWSPEPRVRAALERGFRLSFASVRPTNSRILVALDVSGSMDFGSCVGCRVVRPRMAAVAMAMVTVRTEPLARLMAFSERLVEVPIATEDGLEAVCDRVRALPQGPVDVARPILHAKDNAEVVDAFIVFTDNSVSFGDIHPVQALREYRGAVNPKAKLLVVAMTAFTCSIADPNDKGMLDLCGFDSGAPQLINTFLSDSF